jgi:hypothetical protein
MVTTDEKLREVLDILITPGQYAGPMRLKIVDDYIQLKAKIPSMSREELINTINDILEPAGAEICLIGCE